MKNVISKMLSKLVMVVVYMLVGYTAFNLYLALCELIKSVFHICFGG